LQSQSPQPAPLDPSESAQLNNPALPGLLGVPV
jgi:hypothetical protein